MQYILLSFIHSYILVTIGLISFVLLNRLVNLYNLSMRKSSLASVPSIFTNQLVEPFIFQPSLFNTKPYESITHHPFISSNNRHILTEEYSINTDTTLVVEQLELNYDLPSIEDNTSDLVTTTEVTTDKQVDVIPFTDMPYSKEALSTMSVQQLRDMCNQFKLKWRNANGKNKHLTKQQMIDGLVD